MTESELAAECDRLLEGAGWFVVKTSVDRQTRKQLRGLPDRICFRRNRTLFIEYKAPGGSVRESQWEFWSKIVPLTGPNLQHVIIDDPRQLKGWAIGN